MNRRVQSRERYEDDILAFLMDGLLEEEGRALLEENERLNADPAAAIPAELDERCRALLQSAFPDKPLKKPERVTWKILKRVLAAAVIAATLFATAYAAVPEFRAGVLNFWTEVEKIGTHFYFYSSGEKTPAPTPVPSSPLVIKDGMPFEFTYIPDGYEKYEEFALAFGENATHYLCSYNDKHDEINNFSLEILPVGENSSVIVDTEDATVQNTTIHGYSGMLIQKTDAFTGRNQVQCVWVDERDKLFYSYFSLGISADESQRIFDGIVIYGYEADTPAPTPAPSSPLVIKDGMPFEFSYVPEGYAVFQKLSSEPGEDNIWYSCFYVDEHDDANNFSMEVFSVDESSAGVVDTENATIQNVIIHGHNGMAISKIDTLTQRNQMQYVWLDEENNLFYSYFSLGITSEESQKIFDGIVIYGYEAATPAPTPAPSSPLVIKDGMPFE
ncbi:MAG: DUF4367 domain-containing protein, partial [Oscillospiraceae bacterium]|nr:DUF4367 domain-containing protein [Oscillospiraceae bacterium]